MAGSSYSCRGQRRPGQVPPAQTVVASGSSQVSCGGSRYDSTKPFCQSTQHNDDRRNPCSPAGERQRTARSRRGNSKPLSLGRERGWGEGAKGSASPIRQDPGVHITPLLQRIRERVLQLSPPTFTTLTPGPSSFEEGVAKVLSGMPKAVRCEFALHAMAYHLSRAVALWARAVLSLSQSLQKIRRMGKGPKGRAHHHTAES